MKQSLPDVFLTILMELDPVDRPARDILGY